MTKQKSITKIKHLSPREKTGEITLHASQFGRLWDMGLDINMNPERPGKPYKQVEWVWICVNLIIDVCNSIQLLLSNQNDEIIESGPAYDFIFNNQETPFSKFLSDTIGYYSLDREVYWIYLDKELTAPRNILVAGRNQCNPVIELGVVVGYQLFTQAGQIVPLFLEDVWPILNFNPENNFHGIGPLIAGELSISSNYQSTLYNEATMANGARLGTMLVAPAGTKLDEDERKMLIAQFEARHKGARNAGRTFLATGGLDVKTIGQTMVELQMLDLRKFDAATICSLFRVPPELVALNPEAQYAHGPATQRFIMYTIAPMLSFIAQNISQGILQPFRFKSNMGLSFDKSKIFCGTRVSLQRKQSYKTLRIKAIQSNQKLFAWFDIESHPAVQEMERDKAEKVMKYTQYGVPLNQIIKAYDLPFNPDEIPWGNEWFVGMGQVPARYILEAGPEGITGPAYTPPPEESPPAGEPGKDYELQVTSHGSRVTNDESQVKARLDIWTRWVRSWLPIEREYQSSLRIFFVQIQKELIKNLKAAFESAKSGDERRKTSDEIIAKIVFDIKKANGKLKVINNVFFLKASELGIRQTISEVTGLKGDELDKITEQVKTDPVIRGKLAVSNIRLSNVNKITQQNVSASIKEGLDKGEDLNALTKRIQQELGSNRARALRIARTQCAGAVGTGRQEGMKAAGVDLKSWITAGDEHVRIAHRDAEKATASGIPLNQPYIVAGETLMYPADPAGSPGNIINCRCVSIALAAAGKTFDLNYYTKVNFISAESVKSVANNKESENASAKT